MSPLAAEIGGFIRTEDSDDARFQELALALFAHQFANNRPYRRLCEARGATPESVFEWREIPAAPASAFKRFSLTCVPVASCEPESGGRIFHSSGTTGAETSRHFLDSDALSLYETSLRVGFQLAAGKLAGIIALMPMPHLAPHSSLSFMLDVLIRDLGGAWVWADNLQHSLAELLRRVQRNPMPIAVFGTAFAFMNLFDATQDRFELPEGSLVIETGGFKGRSREVSREELYALIRSRFGVSDENCHSEYGMSEMASQFYSVGVHGRKVGPPWVRTRTIDPITGTDAQPGRPGLLCHYDLANFNSALAVQTEDLGTLHDDGSFELLGRAPGAVLRGCSLLAE